MLTTIDEKNVLPFVAAYKKRLHDEMIMCPVEELVNKRMIMDALKHFEFMLKQDIKSDTHPFLEQVNGDKQ